MTSTKTYFLRTFGCQMNEHDSERMAGMLEAEGYAPVDRPEDAGVVLFNTCCIREKADERLYGNLGHVKSLKDTRPGMRIVVGGCLAQKDRHVIQERAPYVDVVLGTHNLASLPRLLRDAQSGPTLEILEQTEVFPSALPAGRGKEVSRRVGDIVAEVEGLVDQGVSEVTLLGQNVNSYGRDLDGTPMFAPLLRALDEIDGLDRIRFTSPHPKDFRADTEEDFEQTLSLVEEARYDAAFTFQYSSRPMTEAAGMDGHLRKEVVQERYERLVALQESI